MKRVVSVRVNEELWRQAKIRAIENDETLSAMLERLLKKELEGKA